METPLITGLVMFNFSSYPRRPHFIPMHLHHFYQMDVILGGEVTIRVEGRRALQARAGDALLIAPLVNHSYQTKRGWRQGSFKFHLAPTYWRWTGAGIRHRRFSPMLLQAVEAAGHGWQREEPLFREQALAAATQCLIELLRQKANPTSSEGPETFRSKIWQLLERVLTNPHNDWQVANMAQECQLSVDRFSRCFHKLIGVTPKRFLLETRMRAAAAELLARPDRPIKEIADQARYATVHAFTRIFTQVFGIPPGAYRRSPRQM